MVAFDYAVYKETFTWTLESFLGAFGGTLGLWMGLNFINILGFLSAKLFASDEASSSPIKNKMQQRIKILATKGYCYISELYNI